MSKGFHSILIELILRNKKNKILSLNKKTLALWAKVLEHSYNDARKRPSLYESARICAITNRGPTYV